jgi:integrase
MLSEIAIRAAKPREKPYKLSDERGLYLLVNPNGSRWWRFKYSRFGKERGLSLGVYPDVTLAMARKRRDEARTQLADGIDPSHKRKAEKISNANTFRAIAEEWLALQKDKLHVRTYDKARYQLESFVYPRLGDTPITKITAPDLLAALRKIEVRGAHETAHRTKQRCGQIFRYAIATGRAEQDVSVHLRGALAPVVTKNRAALTDPAEVGQLLRAIEGYSGISVTAYALKLAPLTFVRPSELRLAQWCEFDLENAEWRIPAERMKMGDLHIVPLSRQAVELFKELRSISGAGEYVFSSLRSARRPMSNNTVNAALRRLGYAKDEMTGHGFRALASTLLNEQGWHPDLIELQLAHAERNKVRAAYNRAQRLPERRKMMQTWADYLDALRNDKSGTVVNIRAA